jgi:hypothetical protein
VNKVDKVDKVDNGEEVLSAFCPCYTGISFLSMCLLWSFMLLHLFAACHPVILEYKIRVSSAIVALVSIVVSILKTLDIYRTILLYLQ